MKKGDTLFNEQFIILHDDDDSSEIILKKSEIVSITSRNEDDGTCYAIIDMTNCENHIVSESVDEIIELL